MPELPEVETVRRVLLEIIPPEPIQDIIVNYPKIIQNVSVKEFTLRLKGEQLRNIDRKGKYLILHFRQEILISHLRMEGKYRFEKVLVPGKHDHILFQWPSGCLCYSDTRKFGTMHLFHREEDIFNLTPLNKIGPEPFDEGMTPTYLKQQFAAKKQAIKSTLLDQHIISGLGNIYVDEVLFRARIHPQRPTNTISDDELNLIIIEARAVLKEAIDCGGTSIRTFSIGAMHGRFQHQLLIHGKQLCPHCQAPIEKIKVGGRGTYHCKHCQRLDKSRTL